MTSTIKGALQSIKSNLKKIPFVLAIKRRVYRNIYSITKYFFGFTRHSFFQPLLRFTIIRELMFDTTPTSTLLVAQIDSEAFVVSSQDHAVGKMLSCYGILDYEALESALPLLGWEGPLDLLVDVGANIGTVCITAVKRGIAKRAIAIEPGLLNFSLLAANASINQVSDKVTLHNLALGAADDDQVTFELSNTNFGDHRVRKTTATGLHDEDKRETVVIRSETFDTIVGPITASKTLIWMDTQGYEGHILAGATNAITQKVPMILEFWPYGMNRSGSYLPLKQALIGSQYEWLYDLSDPSTKVPLSGEALDTIYGQLGESGKFTDLLII
jgi:FkbM family methyltransferase